MAWLLEHRVNVDVVSGKYTRQRCNDSRPVSDDEAHIVRQFKIAGYLVRHGGWAVRRR